MQALGFAIIAAACIVKVPQILKISQNNSAQGLSLLSFELEQLALSIHGSYGFLLGLPFSGYGEAIVLILQNTFLLAQIYILSKAPVWRPFLAISLFGTALACISTGKPWLVVSMQGIKTVYFPGGLRTPHVLHVCRDGDTSVDQDCLRSKQWHCFSCTPASDLSELRGECP